ncbi:T20D4.11-like domain-containing protein [Caenorhabditis elegans]|uniref:T20D4.11-like domain-containing protein n=1 Tax=Caenorhabditis elegans TaxID=6239 RepID=O16409_CAEEL|nr:DUF19 domain-containing protein [Caenorhabditis elegans]CCD66858.1 DUF19 domain-containing protein [Caenorhabditis elegans]|eukprot:NP_503872.2 Uncharacterized protein CELE_C36C5.4 [Caenorhabditis elegans]
MCGLKKKKEFQSFGSFMAKMYFLDMKKPSSLKKFRDSCGAVADCMESLECSDNAELPATTTVKDACENIIFLTSEFLPCLTKLDELKPAPECAKDWNPSPDKNGSGEEKKPEELCTTMFGKDNCMKKLIIDTCGESDWQLLLNRFKAAPVLKQCDFSGL